MSSLIEKYLSELHDPGKPLVISKLVNLSDLSPDEAEILRREWPGIDVERRRQIVQRLAELAEDNFDLDFEDVFRYSIDDADPEVRLRTIEGLWGCDARSLIDRLLGLVREDEEAGVRAAAAGALGKFTMLAELGKLPQSEVRRIEETLRASFASGSEEIHVRCRVLEAVSPLSKPEVHELIRQAYRSDNIEMRASALYAMGRNCDPGWLPALLKELHSPHSRLRFESVRACAELEAQEAIPRLIELIDDSDSQVRLSSIEALGQIGGSEAKEALRRCLDSEDELIREAAQEALEELGFGEDPLGL